MKDNTTLLFILLIATFLTFYPHLNYPYPLHVDEWFHISEAKMIASNQKTDWYSGKAFNLGMERAWHITLAIIQKLFNPSITQWAFLPTIIHILGIISVYVFVSKLFDKNH